MIDLTDEIVVITGAGGGIGRETAITLANLNAIVMVSDINENSMYETVEIIQRNGGVAKGIVCDVSNYSSVESLVKSVIKEYGKCDVLVNCAGINIDKLFQDLTLTDWNKVIDVNLTGTFNMIQGFIKEMKKQKKGKIINISSISWNGNVGQANYAASKAGVVGLTKTVAKEYARYGITANIVCPGFIDTEMTRGIPRKVVEKLLKRIPIGKMGSPQDVASCIAFLSSKNADYITGELINISGGATL